MVGVEGVVSSHSYVQVLSLQPVANLVMKVVHRGEHALSMRRSERQNLVDLRSCLESCHSGILTAIHSNCELMGQRI